MHKAPTHPVPVTSSQTGSNSAWMKLRGVCAVQRCTNHLPLHRSEFGMYRTDDTPSRSRIMLASKITHGHAAQTSMGCAEGVVGSRSKAHSEMSLERLLLPSVEASFRSTETGYVTTNDHDVLIWKPRPSSSKAQQCRTNAWPETSLREALGEADPVLVPPVR